MTREEAAGKVLEYVYGEMPEDVAREFERILARDAELAAEVDGVRLVRSAAAALKPVELPKDVRRRVMLHAKRRIAMRRKDSVGVFEALERFFLSPSFSGGLALVLALGVGVHILMREGTEDRLTRLEQGERAGAMRAPASEAVPVATPVLAAVPVLEGKQEEPEDRVAGGAKKRAETRVTERLSGATVHGILGGDARGDGAAARLLAPPAKPAPKADPWGYGGLGTSSADGYFTGGGSGAGKVGVAEKAAKAEGGVAGGERGRFSTPPPGDYRRDEMAGPSARDGDEESVQVHPGVAQGPALPVATKAPAAVAPPPPAPSAPVPEQSRVSVSEVRAADVPAKADKVAKEEAERPKDVSEDKKGKEASPLAEARRLKADGNLAAALAAYQKALAGGLGGAVLKQALVEAADVADRLGRTEAATALRKRLAEIQTQAPAATPADTIR